MFLPESADYKCNVLSRQTINSKKFFQLNLLLSYLEASWMESGKESCDCSDDESRVRSEGWMSPKSSRPGNPLLQGALQWFGPAETFRHQNEMIYGAGKQPATSDLSVLSLLSLRGGFPSQPSFYSWGRLRRRGVCDAFWIPINQRLPTSAGESTGSIRKLPRSENR